MSTAFAKLIKRAELAVDRVNAKPFTLWPMTGPANGRLLPDPDRPVIRGRGVLDTRSVAAGIQTGRARKSGAEENNFQTLRVGRQVELSVDRTVYFPTLEALPRQGDGLETEGRQFTVSSAQPDGTSRIRLILIETGSKP